VEQSLKVKLKGQSEPTVSAPYTLYTFKGKGKTISRRLPDIEERRHLEHQVENYHTFQQLYRRLVEIGKAICKEKQKKERS